jgi:hypothetical protein
MQPDFRAGLARLTALGLSLDAWTFHPQLADTVDLARAFPQANVIVGHVGGPLGYGPYASPCDPATDLRAPHALARPVSTQGRSALAVEDEQ